MLARVEDFEEIWVDFLLPSMDDRSEGSACPS